MVHRYFFQPRFPFLNLFLKPAGGKAGALGVSGTTEKSKLLEISYGDVNTIARKNLFG
jgi:hypothetical protein